MLLTLTPYLNRKDLNQELCFSCYNFVLFGHRLKRPSSDLRPLGVPRAQWKFTSLAAWLGNICFTDSHKEAIFISNGGTGLLLKKEKPVLGLAVPFWVSISQQISWLFEICWLFFQHDWGEGGTEPVLFLRHFHLLCFWRPCREKPLSEGAWERGGEGRAWSKSSSPCLWRDDLEGRVGCGSPGQREACAELVWNFCWRKCRPAKAHGGNLPVVGDWDVSSKNLSPHHPGPKCGSKPPRE